MKQQSEPIVFFGSGPVAAESLVLLSKWANIEAIVTKPQPSHHKAAFPVLTLAEELGIPVHTPNGKAELSALIATKPFRSRLGIVIDYGFIINQDVIDYFPLGIINSHFSLLPEWRGADPISFAILSGQAMTGVSLMLIVEKMDEGPLLGYGEEPLDGTETTPSLTKSLIRLSNGLLQYQVPKHLASDNRGGLPQSSTGRHVSYSRKLTKDDGILDWNKPAVQLEREIRAFIEWPKSRTTLAGKDVVVTKAHVVEPIPTASIGDVVVENKELRVQTSDGALAIDYLKPAGKNDMPAAAFLAGYGKNIAS